MSENQTKEGLFAVLKKQFMAGLLAIFPISFSIYILFWLFQKIDLIVGKPISQHVNFYFSGFGFIILFVFIWLIGVITSSYFGSKLVKLHDNIVNRIPILRSVFRTIKQLSNTVLGESSGAFTQPVLAEAFASERYSLGFLTNRARVIVPNANGENKTMVHVFIPKVPNPTAGFLVLVEEEKVIKLNITMEEAFKTIITAGLICPEQYGFKNELSNEVAEKLLTAGQPSKNGKHFKKGSGSVEKVKYKPYPFTAKEIEGDPLAGNGQVDKE